MSDTATRDEMLDRKILAEQLQLLHEQSVAVVDNHQMEDKERVGILIALANEIAHVAYTRAEI